MSIPVATRIPTIIAMRFLKIIRAINSQKPIPNNFFISPKWVAKVIKTIKEAADLHKDFVNL
jgi:hypothetical protein